MYGITPSDHAVAVVAGRAHCYCPLQAAEKDCLVLINVCHHRGRLPLQWLLLLLLLPHLPILQLLAQHSVQGSLVRGVPLLLLLLCLPLLEPQQQLLQLHCAAN